MTQSATDPQLPISILDTDLYKLTMQSAVLKHYPDVSARYQFTNRRKTDKFTRKSFDLMQAKINDLSKVSLSSDERDWLSTTCPYFTEEYLNFLTNFRFRPHEQVEIKFIPENSEFDTGDIELAISGKWADTILYEVPIMAIISECYFTRVDTQWDYTGQKQNAYQKGKKLAKAGCIFSEFGTRRRRTYSAQKVVLQGLLDARRDFEGKEGYSGKLSGTSNVHFAHFFGIQPIGTIAHEWTMGVAAIEGYNGANGLALDKWDESYPDGKLDIALTDTFSSKIFFQDFVQNVERAKRWRGLRQDSGDPKAFAKEAVKIYRQLGIDPKTKTIVFSDGLSPDMCLDLQQFSTEIGIGCSFGVGTNLTNDFKRVEKPTQETNKGEGDFNSSGADSKALNMVIKLWEIDGKPCVKISDELTKNSGDKEAVLMIKQRFGLET